MFGEQLFDSIPAERFSLCIRKERVFGFAFLLLHPMTQGRNRLLAQWNATGLASFSGAADARSSVQGDILVSQATGNSFTLEQVLQTNKPPLLRHP